MVLEANILSGLNIKSQAQWPVRMIYRNKRISREYLWSVDMVSPAFIMASADIIIGQLLYQNSWHVTVE